MGLPPVRASTALSFCNTTEKIAVESPYTSFVPHSVKALLNSHHIQHFSASCLTSYEVLLLTVLHIILLHCNNLSPDTLPLCHQWSSSWLLSADGPLLNSSWWSIENFLNNTDFLKVLQWLFVKSDHGKYCAWANKTLFNITAMTTLAQQAEILYIPKVHACALAKGKTSNIYTDSRYIFRVAHDFLECCESNVPWPYLGEIKMKDGSYVQKLLGCNILSAV